MSELAAALAFISLTNSVSTAAFTVLETSLQTVQDEGSRSSLCVSQNLITLAFNRSLASSTAATLLPEPLLDLECPLDLDLVLHLKGDPDRKHSFSEEEVSSLYPDP